MIQAAFTAALQFVGHILTRSPERAPDNSPGTLLGINMNSLLLPIAVNPTIIYLWAKHTAALFYGYSYPSSHIQQPPLFSALARYRAWSAYSSMAGRGFLVSQMTTPAEQQARTLSAKGYSQMLLHMSSPF